MSLRHEGNGEGKTRIDFVERASYVLICPHDPANLPENIAAIINTAFIDWMKRNPGIRIREVLPITQDGQTVAIHVWYDKSDVEVSQDQV